MRPRWCRGALLIWLVGLFQPLAAQQGDWMALQRRLVEIYEENKDSLVRVKAAYDSDTGEGGPQVVIGTGFFISNQGLVLTNASVVHQPDRVWVEHRDVGYSAEVVGSDASSNLALLRLDTLPREFGYLHLADSTEMPAIGRFVIRLSMPLDFAPTPDLGLVAGFESRFGGRFFPCKYIRTSIGAAPGDGGAAYLDLSGRLVGLQVGSLPEVGATYVLPARAAMRLRDDFLFTGEISYGWIGFEVREESNVQSGKRLALAEVIPGAPAEDAGLRADDILVRVGEFSVKSVDDLRNAMFYTRVGQYVTVGVHRDGQPMEFSVRLAERPADEPMEIIRPLNPSRETFSPMRPQSSADPLEDPRFPVSPRAAQDEEKSGRVPLQKRD